MNTYRYYKESGLPSKILFHYNVLLRTLTEKTSSPLEFPEASQAHDEIFNVCINTDFLSFRSPINVVNFTKKVMDLLNIEFRIF